MAENTKIEWAHHTFNPWEGCTKVGPGCDHCYAETRNARYGGGTATNWGPGAPRRRTSPANWHNPLRWNRQAIEHGIRYRVFCASLADWLDNEVPIEWLADLLNLVRITPNLDWLLLSKRIGNWETRLRSVLAYILSDDSVSYRADLMAWLEGWLGGGRPPANVWLGATVVNQSETERDIPKLLETPAALRWLSMEPLLGPVDLTAIKRTVAPGFFGDALHWYHRGYCHEQDGIEYPSIDWIIVGGESGPSARPMHPDWARALRDQCAAAGTPFLFKQWGEWCPRGPLSMGYSLVDDAPRVRLTDTGDDGSDLAAEGDSPVWMNRAGKKRTGRLLDGEQHDGFPSSPAEGHRYA